MQRQRKLLIAKVAILVSALPFLLWAYEYGPDAGYSSVPRESGDCTSIGCHVGTANSGPGSVTVTFPNGMTYVPGVKQRVRVTIADPAQRAWGFQLTPRLSSNSATMAGSVVSSDANTSLMCASANLFNQQQVNFSATGSQTCPASMTLQYIEHSLVGYNATRGNGSGSYEFDWTPPATDVGPVDIYVAGNAANGDLTSNGDRIYTKKFTLQPAAGGSSPTIAAAGVQNGASFGEGIVPNSWVTIVGSNLSTTTDVWDNFIVNGKLPTSLSGVTVTVGGKVAYIYYVSPTQINAVAPDVGTGTMQVTVSNSAGTSAAATANSATVQPAFFAWVGKYAVATRQDFSWAVKNGTFPGTSTTAAKPGDVVILWGTGFGPTNPAAPVGVQLPADKTYSTISPVTVTVNNTPATVFGAALAPGFAALYQVAIQIPANAPDGDLPVVATIDGAQSPATTLITVQK
jgi:uncharacterized protein (TIGR03437 family)